MKDTPELRSNQKFDDLYQKKEELPGLLGVLLFYTTKPIDMVGEKVI